MKKTALFLSLIAIPLTMVQAKGSDIDNVMNVKIINLGAENCILQETKLANGSLNPASSFPQMLSTNGTKNVFQIIGKQYHRDEAVTTADLKLTYHCGEYKKFTLSMKQYFKKGHYHGAIDATMQDSVDVFETHEVVAPKRNIPSKNITPKAGSVYWAISN